MKAFRLFAIAMLVGLTACESPWYRLERDNHNLLDDVSTLEAENAELRAHNEKLKADLRSAGQTVEDIQTAEARYKQELQALRNSLGSDVEVSAQNGQITVALPNSILFSSGRHSLKKESKKTLHTLVKLLNAKYMNYQISVEGHTDSDPITKSKDRYDDNYDLSAHRARSVLKFLEDKGVKAKRLRGAFYGPNRPKAKSKSKNRRVEIVLIR